MRAFILTAAAVIAADRITKYIIKVNLDINHAVKVIENFFYITHIENRGIAFGLLGGGQEIKRWALVAVTFAAIILITAYWAKNRKEGALFNVSCGLITGGAAGNFIDRAFTGRVTDFLQFGYNDYTFPIFNAADSAITIGVGLFIIYIFKSGKEEKQKGKEDGE